MSLIEVKLGMPLDEFIRLSHEQEFELINGERRPKLATVLGHSETVRFLFKRMDTHISSYGAGEVYAETTFVLPDTDVKDWVVGSRIPDLMFFQSDRVAAYKAQHPDYRERPLPLVPDFVIEVVSPTDKVSELDEKIDAYLADGVRLIWVIDPQRRKATVYAPDMEQPRHLVGDAMLDASDVLPGFQVKLSSLFG